MQLCRNRRSSLHVIARPSADDPSGIPGIRAKGWAILYEEAGGVQIEHDHADAEIDDLPFMSSLGPVLTILAVYLVFVLKVGPSYMRKREAFKLSTTMLILFGTYLYFTAKLTELLDTVFFVVRKKDNQITFLHLYHHTIMVIGTWALLKYSPTHTLIFIGFLNSLVHVFMYTYYGLAALGPNVAKYLTWKKYMTKFQLIQFVSIIIQYVATIRVSDCPPCRGISIFIAGNTFFILILFLNFYRQSYMKKKSSSTSNSNKSKNSPKVCVKLE
ncbi:Elongation of very long chain fatty acids protein [Operophtera brumata]|uniref:Elongation of very long chain fatty acids protein n=1 Tax=Operophtera brumata TaxID=104452 RepID=A0A0L7KZE9_OPEBR|nr:Elongation of very long chain fatty acids protein [Operophtera brumata]